MLLKCLAIIGMLFANFLVYVDAQETSHPTPRAQASQHPFPAVAPVVAKNGDTPAHQADGHQEQSGSEDKPFWIALPQKDVYDWIAYGANLVLVLVGVLGVVVGVCTILFIKAQVIEMRRQRIVMQKTLLSIQRQAGHMERQTGILEDSVAAAQKAANAALDQVEAAKSTQRAQLRIEFEEPEFTFNEELGGYPIRFQVILDGTTRAYIPEESILAYIDQTARKTKAVWVDTGLPRDFTPEMSPFEGYTLIYTNTGFPEVDTDPGKADLVHTHNYTVFVDGHILYRDIFGDRWRLEFDRVWVPTSRYAGKNTTGGTWQPFGSGKGDTHRKVDPYKKTAPEKAN
jgi:hypothetical protein